MTEQTLGRGLRLPFDRYTGVELLDTLDVLGHERYEDLLRKANVLNEQFIDRRTRAILRQDAAGRALPAGDAAPAIARSSVGGVDRAGAGQPAPPGGRDRRRLPARPGRPRRGRPERLPRPRRRRPAPAPGGGAAPLRLPPRLRRGGGADHLLSADEQVGADWRYLLLSESDLKAAKGSWPALQRLGER